MKKDPKERENRIRELVRSTAQPWPAEAFLHADAACQVAVEKKDPKSQKKHVTAAECAAAFVVLAAHRYGLLAGEVLRTWRVRHSLDVGTMIFVLVDDDLWQKRAGESVADFLEFYDDIPAAATRRAREDLLELSLS